MIRVSTIIPAYNAESTIGATIDSALAQEFDGQEIIAVDDGSTDQTGSVLETYGNAIRVVTQNNRGPSAARNSAARIARGQYLAFLDADDVWLPGKLAKTYAALEQNPPAVLCFSQMIRRDESGSYLVSYPEFVPSMDDMLEGRYPLVWTGTVVMRSAAFHESAGFSEEYRLAGWEDAYMWTVAREFGEFVHVPEPLAIYNAPNVGLAADKYRSGFETFLRVVRKRYGKRAGGLVRKAKREMARLELRRALAQIDVGNVRESAISMARVLSWSPALLAEPELLRRLLRRQNAWRVVSMLTSWLPARHNRHNLRGV